MDFVKRLRHAALATSVVAFVCLCCSPDYTVPLRNGYFVARVHSGAFGVVSPQNRGITPLSTSEIEVALVGDIVAGRVDPSDFATPSEGSAYFVVNTRTAAAHVDLTWQDYLMTLRANGISAPPQLRRISRFTRF